MRNLAVSQPSFAKKLNIFLAVKVCSQINATTRPKLVKPLIGNVQHHQSSCDRSAWPTWQWCWVKTFKPPINKSSLLFHHLTATPEFFHPKWLCRLNSVNLEGLMWKTCKYFLCAYVIECALWLVRKLRSWTPTENVSNNLLFHSVFWCSPLHRHSTTRRCYSRTCTINVACMCRMHVRSCITCPQTATSGKGSFLYSGGHHMEV